MPLSQPEADGHYIERMFPVASEARTSYRSSFVAAPSFSCSTGGSAGHSKQARSGVEVAWQMIDQCWKGPKFWKTVESFSVSG